MYKIGDITVVKKGNKMNLNKIIFIGTKLSNVAFNWSQDTKRFTQEEIKLLEELVTEWDEAIRQFHQERKELLELVEKEGTKWT